jgi:archaellum component FlaG (FlaF/FlaG flagellin family)
MKCTLALSGANRLEIACSADDDLVAEAETVTRVEAMADLRMEVKDPEGPVPIGSDASYELHIRNRGTKAAENVDVLTYFSNGVEPVSADGQGHRLSPGQVVFDRIPAIPPAAEIVLTVKAKAGVAGNHVFRAEVHCKPMGTRLVREEVTHFYQDGPSLQQATVEPAKPSPTPAPTPAARVTRDELRTAERPAPLPLPQSPGQPLPTPAIQR